MTFFLSLSLLSIIFPSSTNQHVIFLLSAGARVWLSGGGGGGGLGAPVGVPGCPLLLRHTAAGHGAEKGSAQGLGTRPGRHLQGLQPQSVPQSGDYRPDTFF